MSCTLDTATTFVMSASTPYGVRRMTSRTSFITQACAVSMAVSTRSPFTASSLSRFNAATPRNAAKITTPMMDVGLAPVSSANGFFGIKDCTSCGTDRSATLPT